VAETQPTDDIPRPGRSAARRSLLAQRAIIAAAQALLTERGYGPLTIEAVAARAGVGKQTIYRWWRSKAELVLEAYLSATLERAPPPPDTGSVRRDVHRLMESHVSAMAEPGVSKIVAGLIEAAQHDPALADGFRREVVATRRKIMRDILERGRDRGELRPGADLDLAVDMLHGPTFYRLLVSGAPLDRAFARRLTDQVLETIVP
jgi:AcrR family transcriptional regulator